MTPVQIYTRAHLAIYFSPAAKLWFSFVDLFRKPCRIKDPFILALLRGPDNCIDMFYLCMGVERIKWYRRKAVIYCKEYSIELISRTIHSEEFVTPQKLSHFLTQLKISIKFKRPSKNKNIYGDMWVEGYLPYDETYESFASFLKLNLNLDPYLFQ